MLISSRNECWLNCRTYTIQDTIYAIVFKLLEVMAPWLILNCRPWLCFQISVVTAAVALIIQSQRWCNLLLLYLYNSPYLLPWRLFPLLYPLEGESKGRVFGELLGIFQNPLRFDRFLTWFVCETRPNASCPITRNLIAALVVVLCHLRWWHSAVLWWCFPLRTVTK